MQGLNRAISFILGLIVVVVFIAVVSGKIKLGSIIPSLSRTTTKAVVSPTPTPTGTAPAVTQTNTTTNTYKTNGNTASNTTGGTTKGGTNTVTNVTTIPNTGVPTLLIPFFLSSGIVGTFLRKIGKKS